MHCNQARKTKPKNQTRYPKGPTTHLLPTKTPTNSTQQRKTPFKNNQPNKQRDKRQPASIKSQNQNPFQSRKTPFPRTLDFGLVIVVCLAASLLPLASLSLPLSSPSLISHLNCFSRFSVSESMSAAGEGTRREAKHTREESIRGTWWTPRSPFP